MSFTTVLRAQIITSRLNFLHLNITMALTYTRLTLVGLSSGLQNNLHPNLWRSLTQLGISRIKPTRRGCRAGLRKFCTSNQRYLLLLSAPTSNNPNYVRSLPSSTDFFQDKGNLHNFSTTILNIQYNTFPVSDNNNIPEADAGYSCITARITDHQKTNLASKNNL